MTDLPASLTSASTGAIPSGATLQVDQALQTQALAILTTNCATCHNTATNGGVTQILDVTHLLAVGLVVAGDPTQGRLMGAIQAGTMPLGGSPVSAADQTTLKNWILSMHYVLAGGTPAPAPGPVPLPAGKVVIADATLHGQAMAIINTNCAGCHQGMASGGIDNILDINQLTINGLIVPGDPTQGTMLSAIATTMPKGNGARVTAADVATLKSWISSMTIVDQSLAPTPLPTRAALTATFAGVSANIFAPKCYACHGPVKSTDYSFSVYGNVKNSTGDISSVCQSGSMPQSPYPAVTATELAALKAWIAAGALNN